jgi:hypothetical protein
MPRYLVRQPNGKLAEFSTIVDAFTILDMTVAEAVEHYTAHMSHEEAVAKVCRGLEDQPLDGGPPGSGHDRWDDCLRTMARVNPEELERQRRDYPDIFGTK